ncbi:aminoacyl-tRNA hydrolase [bacterium]|nr:aminoacyl-tRNA hydrolase [bacterium]
MKLVAGLGNIGDKYVFTRHNAGFMVVDKWALDKGLSFREEKKLKCFMVKFRSGGEDIILIKPTTFMNLSGEAIRAVIDYYKIDNKDVLIIYDDLSLPLGKIRFRPDGSDGGHNGIKSLIKHLGTSNFARLKIGIGPQPPVPSETFVLQNFSKDQLPELKNVLKTSVEAVNFYFENGMQKTQNVFN